MPRKNEYSLRAAVILFSLIPHTGKEKLQVWQAGNRWTTKDGKVKQARKRFKTEGIATHEAHLNGKNITEAGTSIESPNANTAIIVARHGDWRLIHNEEEYKILTWRDLEGGGTHPVARKHKGRMVYLLRKIQ